jgi:hypothetical protein
VNRPYTRLSTEYCNGFAAEPISRKLRREPFPHWCSQTKRASTCKIDIGFLQKGELTRRELPRDSAQEFIHFPEDKVLGLGHPRNEIFAS